MSDYKKCPYCAEDIMLEAIKCKHCGEWLEKKSDITVKNIATHSHIQRVDKRTRELVLGLLGGFIGITTGFIQIFFGAFAGDGIMSLGFSAIIFSVLGILGGFISKSNGKIGAVIFITATLGGFISSSIFFVLPGIMFIIAGVMGIKKPLQVGKSFKALYWIIISVFILMIIFVYSFWNNQESNPIELDQTAYYIEDLVIAGDLTYVLDKVSTNNSIQSHFETIHPKGTFVVLEITVTNNGKEAKSIDSNLFELHDNQNRIYDVDFNATSAFDINDIFLASLGPGLSSNLVIVFDVPTLDVPYSLGVRSGMFNAIDAWIHLAKSPSVTVEEKEIIDEPIVSKEPVVEKKDTISLPSSSSNKKTLKISEAQSLIDGNYFTGYIQDNFSDNQRSFFFRVTSYNEFTGAIIGELDWPTLNAKHRIDGYFWENSEGSFDIDFEETAFIEEGDAILGRQYYASLIDSQGHYIFEGLWEYDKDNQEGSVYFEENN